MPADPKQVKAALTKLHEAIHESDKALETLKRPVVLQLAVNHLREAADALSALLVPPR